ncbi:helicase ARIP4-like isoform X2 [Tachypleus tridentatus]|uniref:helicase ARIP4-like isoform X2 n=1 Tax=Tachypleus tridentatus TaxID=6853 RepID=UPI003FD2D0F7
MDSDDFSSGSLLGGHTKAHHDRLKAWDEGFTELEKILEAAENHQTGQSQTPCVEREVMLGPHSLSVSPISADAPVPCSEKTKGLGDRKMCLEKKKVVDAEELPDETREEYSSIKADISETPVKKRKLSSSNETIMEKNLSALSGDGHNSEKNEKTNTDEKLTDKCSDGDILISGTDISHLSEEKNNENGYGSEKEENVNNEKLTDKCSDSDVLISGTDNDQFSEHKSNENSDSFDSESDYSEEEDKKKKPTKKKKNLFQRREIRNIMSENELDAKTIQAQKEEQERKKFLQETQLRALQERLLLMKRLEENPEIQLTCISTPPAASVQPQQSTETLPAAVNNSVTIKKELTAGKRKASDKDVILVGSSDEESNKTCVDQSKKLVRTLEVVANSKDILKISSENYTKTEKNEKSNEEVEDDDVVMVSDDDDNGTLDEDNSGTHTNDTLNQPNEDGLVLVNIGHPPEEPDIFLAPQLSRAIKPHQIGGVRFLYDNVVESLERFKTSGGFGCILAHSMGLGKTLQIISFTEVFLRHTSARTVLCIVPINTLQNWMAEFNMWLPHEKSPYPSFPPEEFTKRNFDVFILNENYKTLAARADLILEWRKNGGVLLMGYEMFRTFALKKMPYNKKRRDAKKELDLKDVERNSQLLEEVYLAVVNPGPDLVICDEGHRIKNSHASTSVALKSIRTKRRVVLTGYPLQNNLLEYWCMVDFVRPNYLGTRNEFCNMFERPIQNGQCLDSTPRDRKQMRYRAHVLHSLLEGFVQRRGHLVLKSILPPKEEHVLLVRMTPIQRKLYNTLVRHLRLGNNVCNPLKFFAICCKIWNHPDVLYKVLEDQKNQGNYDIDLDFEFGLPGTRQSNKPGETNSVRGKYGKTPAVQGTGMNKTSRNNYIQEVGFAPFRDRNDKITYEWASPLMVDYQPRILENSYKMEVLFAIIEQTICAGDKLLVFSQSLFTLNLLEDFLAVRAVPLRSNLEKWCRNVNYFRLDGSTNGLDREKLINDFNSNPSVNLFLLSTRAGCLGINLIGANRIVVCDASWNPCHDAQAVCRIYRYGQSKPCHIYRLVTDNSLENKIYERQVNKQGMSDRVVDELNPSTNFTWSQVTNLVNYQEEENPVPDLSDSAAKATDPVIRYLCQNMNYCLSKEPFEHESLLIDRKELKLTKFEKRIAKQTYELEKRASMCGSGFMKPVYFNNGQFPVNPLGRPPLHGPPRGYPGTWYARSQPSTSVPVQPMSNMVGGRQVSPYVPLIQFLMKQGVNVQRVTVPTTVSIPSNSVPGQSIVLPAGQEILVLRTPKGVYLRLPDGRLVAVRLPPELAENFRRQGQVLNGQFAEIANAAHQNQSPVPTSGNRQNQRSYGIVQPTLQCGGTVQFSSSSLRKTAQTSPPEVIDLSDDDDEVENNSKPTKKDLPTDSSSSSTSCSETSSEEDNLKKPSSSRSWTSQSTASYRNVINTSSKELPAVPIAGYLPSFPNKQFSASAPNAVSFPSRFPNRNIFHQMVSDGHLSVSKSSKNQLDGHIRQNPKSFVEGHSTETKKSSHLEQHTDQRSTHVSMSYDSGNATFGGTNGIKPSWILQDNSVHKENLNTNLDRFNKNLPNQYSSTPDITAYGEHNRLLNGQTALGSNYDKQNQSMFISDSLITTSGPSLPVYTNLVSKGQDFEHCTTVSSEKSANNGHLGKDNLDFTFVNEMRDLSSDRNNFHERERNNFNNEQHPGPFKQHQGDSTQRLNPRVQEVPVFRSKGQRTQYYQNTFSDTRQGGFIPNFVGSQRPYPQNVGNFQQFKSESEITLPSKEMKTQNSFCEQRLMNQDVLPPSVLKPYQGNAPKGDQLVCSLAQESPISMQNSSQPVFTESSRPGKVSMPVERNQMLKHKLHERSFFSPSLGARSLSSHNNLSRLPSFSSESYIGTVSNQGRVLQSTQSFLVPDSHAKPNRTSTSNSCVSAPVDTAQDSFSASASTFLSQKIDNDFTQLDSVTDWEGTQNLSAVEKISHKDSNPSHYST